MPYRSSNARVAVMSMLSGRSRGISTKSSPASAAPPIAFCAPSGVHSPAQIKAWAPNSIM